MFSRVFGFSVLSMLASYKRTPVHARDVQRSEGRLNIFHNKSSSYSYFLSRRASSLSYEWICVVVINAWRPFSHCALRNNVGAIQLQQHVFGLLVLFFCHSDQGLDLSDSASSLFKGWVRYFIFLHFSAWQMQTCSWLVNGSFLSVAS